MLLVCQQLLWLAVSFCTLGFLLVLGYFLHSTRLIAIYEVWNFWFYLWTFNKYKENEETKKETKNKIEESYILFCVWQSLLESIPQIIVHVLNNVGDGNPSAFLSHPVAMLSLVASGLMVLLGIGEFCGVVGTVELLESNPNDDIPFIDKMMACIQSVIAMDVGVQKSLLYVYLLVKDLVMSIPVFQCAGFCSRFRELYCWTTVVNSTNEFDDAYQTLHKNIKEIEDLVEELESLKFGNPDVIEKSKELREAITSMEDVEKTVDSFFKLIIGLKKGKGGSRKGNVVVDGELSFLNRPSGGEDSTIVDDGASSATFIEFKSLLDKLQDNSKSLMKTEITEKKERMQGIYIFISPPNGLPQPRPPLLHDRGIIEAVKKVIDENIYSACYLWEYQECSVSDPRNKYKIMYDAICLCDIVVTLLEAPSNPDPQPTSPRPLDWTTDIFSNILFKESYLKNPESLFVMFIAANLPSSPKSYKREDLTSSEYYTPKSRTHLVCFSDGGTHSLTHPPTHSLRVVPVPSLKIRFDTNSASRISIVSRMWEELLEGVAISGYMRKLILQCIPGQDETVNQDNLAAEASRRSTKCTDGIDVYSGKDGRYEGFRYVGVVRGFGQMLNPNGELYIGEYKISSGKFTYHTLSSAAAFIGPTPINDKEYKAVLRYPYDSVYEGAMKDGKYSGRGKYTYFNGNTYDGYWSNSKRVTVEVHNIFKQCTITDGTDVTKTKLVKSWSEWSEWLKNDSKPSASIEVTDIDEKILYSGLYSNDIHKFRVDLSMMKCEIKCEGRDYASFWCENKKIEINGSFDTVEIKGGMNIESKQSGDAIKIFWDDKSESGEGGLYFEYESSEKGIIGKPEKLNIVGYMSIKVTVDVLSHNIYPVATEESGHGQSPTRQGQSPTADANRAAGTKATLKVSDAIGDYLINLFPKKEEHKKEITLTFIEAQKGVLKDSKGETIYEGEWRDDTPDGIGRWNYPNGDVYEGSLTKGKRNGYGKLVCKPACKLVCEPGCGHGDKYVGTFKDDKMHGRGTLQRYCKGEKYSTYTGDFRDNKYYGKGKIVYHFNGHEFDGDFVNNKKHGKGTYTTGSDEKKRNTYDVPPEYYGKVYLGTWKNDNFMGNPYDESEIRVPLNDIILLDPIIEGFKIEEGGKYKEGGKIKLTYGGRGTITKCHYNERDIVYCDIEYDMEHKGKTSYAESETHVERKRIRFCIEEDSKVEVKDKGPGKITNCRGDGTFDITYDDSTRETLVEEVRIQFFLKNGSEFEPTTAPIEAGSKVEVDYRGRGRWYSGKVTNCHGNDKYDIKYDDKMWYVNEHSEEYCGGWKDGHRNGRGVMMYNDGTVMYKGNFKRDSYHGQGELFSPDGTAVHSGEFGRFIDNDFVKEKVNTTDSSNCSSWICNSKCCSCCGCCPV